MLRAPPGRLLRLRHLVECGFLLFLAGLLAEPPRGLLGVGDPQTVAVGQPDGLRERRAHGAVLLLLIARQLVALLLERAQQLPQLLDLRERQRLFSRGQIFLQRVERGVGGRAVAEDRDPVVDLGALDLHRRLELLLGAHDRVGRHLAEVPREHRVAAALLDFLVGRGPARRQRRLPVHRSIDRRGLEVELLLDELDVRRLRGGADRRGFAVEVVVVRGLGCMGFLLGVSTAAGCLRGPSRHRMERRVATASLVADDRGRAALALAHDRCFLARERVGGLGGSFR